MWKKNCFHYADNVNNNFSLQSDSFNIFCLFTLHYNSVSFLENPATMLHIHLSKQGSDHTPAILLLFPVLLLLYD